MPYVEILNLPLYPLKFVLLILDSTFLIPLPRNQNPDFQTLHSNGLMIKPKLLNPVFKDLYKSKTTFQSHSSPKGVLHCRQSGLLCSLLSQCLCFYYCPTWALFQTQPLMQPHSTFCFPHEIFSFYIWCYISLL